MSSGKVELTWTDKALRLLSHGADTYEWVTPNDWRVTEVRTLKYVETIGKKGSGNLLIEGDAAHALDAILKIPELAKKYKGKVKLCYIDPPFNTGQAFENYNDALENSVWLTMMRDRLNQIKDLLAVDGSVWLHLDDVQAHRARSVLDEIFGPENFIATIAWQKADSPRMDSKQFSFSQDYIHVYSRNLGWVPNRVAQKLAPASDFPYVEEDGRRYKSSPLRKWGKNSARADRPNLWYSILNPNGVECWPIKPDGTEGNWRWKKSKVERDAHLIQWIDKGSGLQPYQKEYFGQEKREVPPVTWWDNEFAGHNRSAKAHGKQLFGRQEAFDTPKPEQLLQHIIRIGSNPGDLILDCYGGSGTTAAVAHKMSRKWVTIEMLPKNVEKYIKPRLSTVVAGQDPGGITMESSVVLSDELPPEVTPEDVKITADTLREISLSGSINSTLLDDEEEFEALIKELKALARRSKIEQKVWDGGGGFDFLRVEPSLFVEVDGVLGLAAWATGGWLTKGVAAQVGYEYSPDGLFAGAKGRSRLAVLDGMLTTGIVDFLVSQLNNGETILIFAQTLEPGIDSYLRTIMPGSRCKKIPRDLAKASPLSKKVVKIKAKSADFLDLEVDVKTMEDAS